MSNIPIILKQRRKHKAAHGRLKVDSPAVITFISKKQGYVKDLLQLCHVPPKPAQADPWQCHKKHCSLLGVQKCFCTDMLSQRDLLRLHKGPCCSITTTIPVIVAAQKTSSQTHQSATIKAEQAVSLLSSTVDLESWESCLLSLALCKRRCGYTSPFSHGSEISHRALRPLRSFYIKLIHWEDLHVIKSVKNVHVITADIIKALTEKWPEGRDLTEQGKGDYSVHIKIDKRLKAIIYMFIFFSSPWNSFCWNRCPMQRAAGPEKYPRNKPVYHIGRPHMWAPRFVGDTKLCGGSDRQEGRDII